MSQITEQIWVGSYGDASSDQYLSERRITHVITCADEFPSSIIRPGYRIPIVDDVADYKTKKYFLEAASILDRWVKEGNKIMVHCFAGMSRSVSVVITYFIVYKGWSFDVAHSHLRQRRHQTKVHPAFIPILKEIESEFRLPLQEEGYLQAQLGSQAQPPQVQPQ
jgi:atypical dual specificity phosphatase